MAQIGSFALLLALALSIYSFGVGLLALFCKDDPLWDRLGETARRAGVVVFGGSPSRRHRPRDLRLPQRFHHRLHFSSQQPRSSRPRTNSPRCGPARKARCCSGRCCSPDTASSCACATRPIPGCSPTPRSFSPECRSSFCCSSISPPIPSACSKAPSAPTAADSIPFCNIPRWSSTRPCSIWAMLDSPCPSPSRWAR